MSGYHILLALSRDYSQASDHMMHDTLAAAEACCQVRHAADLLKATNNEQVAISHNCDAGVPAAPVHIVHHAVCLGVRVEQADGLNAVGQEVTIQVQRVTCSIDVQT